MIILSLVIYLIFTLLLLLFYNKVIIPSLQVSMGCRLQDLRFVLKKHKNNMEPELYKEFEERLKFFEDKGLMLTESFVAKLKEYAKQNPDIYQEQREKTEKILSSGEQIKKIYESFESTLELMFRINYSGTIIIFWPIIIITFLTLFAVETSKKLSYFLNITRIHSDPDPENYIENLPIKNHQALFLNAA